MNCKPGEIAVQIRGEQENIGIFLRVLQPTFENGKWWWTFEDASRTVLLWDDYGLPAGSASSTAEGMPVEAFVCDADLFPIRDPGEDAKDETLQWLPVPAKETV